MADVPLFHHAFGRTAGILAFADEVRQAGHTVHVPEAAARLLIERIIRFLR